MIILNITEYKLFENTKQKNVKFPAVKSKYKKRILTLEQAWLYNTRKPKSYCIK